jgi:hypothetical protein
MKVAVASAVMLAVLGLVQGHSYHLGATCPNVEPVSNFNLDKVSRLVILINQTTTLDVFRRDLIRWGRQHLMMALILNTLILFVSARSI